MNEKTKWLAAIYQEYTALRAGLTGTRKTQVVQLHIAAASAHEAMDTAEKWLAKSGIENAYVSEVCVDGMLEVDLTEL